MQQICPPSLAIYRGLKHAEIDLAASNNEEQMQ
jgi:hypothetical protein